MSAEPVAVRIRRLSHAHDLPFPAYQTPGAAAMDLHAAVAEPLDLAPGEAASVPCGIALALPESYEAQIRPRSGLAVRHLVTVLNTPGTIDGDYRGEIVVILINHGKDVFQVKRGDRIAQLVVSSVERAHWVEVEVLPETTRGSQGLGHTGR